MDKECLWSDVEAEVLSLMDNPDVPPEIKYILAEACFFFTSFPPQT